MISSTFKVFLGLMRLAVLLTFYAMLIVVSTSLELYDGIFHKSK